MSAERPYRGFRPCNEIPGIAVNASSYHRGLLLVTLSAIAWSLAGYFTRLIGLDAWTMLVWRGIFGALGIAVVIVALNGKNTTGLFLRLGRPGWLFVAVSAAGMVCFITSLRHTTVTHSAVIYATVPFIAAFLGWVFLRETPTRSAVTASLAALVGVGVMVGFGVEGGLLGDLLAFGMTLAMAVMMVIARRHPGIPVLPAACLSALASGLVVWPFGHPLDVTGSDLFYLALFGLVNSAAGLTLFTFGARLLPAIETALIGSLDAPLAPLWVWLAFGETPSHQTLAGAVIVFAAVFFHVARSAAGRRRNGSIRTVPQTADTG